MSDGQPANIVLLVSVRAAQFLLYSIILWHAWRWFFRSSDSRCVLPSFGEMCRALCRKCWSLCACRKQPNMGSVAEAVQKKLDDMRLQQSLCSVKVCTHCAGPVLFVVCAWYEFSSPSTATVNFLVTAGCSMVCYLVGLLITFEVVTLTPRRLDVLFAMSMAAFALMALGVQDVEWMLIANGLRATFRMFVTSVYMEQWKALPWHILIAIVTAYRVYSSNLPYAHTLVFYEVITGVLIMALCCVYRQWAESHCRVQITVENQKAAAFTLLGFQCEVVMWLSDDLRIRGPAPQLAGLLLHGNVPGNLAGNEFEQYIASDCDRHRFRQFLAASMSIQQASRAPSAVRLNLRDATNTSFPVEIFHVHCMDDDDTFGHLIGIMATDRERGQPAMGEQVASLRVQPPPVPTPAPQISAHATPSIIGNAGLDGEDRLAGHETDGAGGLTTRGDQDLGSRAHEDQARNAATSENQEHGAASSSGANCHGAPNDNTIASVPLFFHAGLAAGPTCVLFDAMTTELLGCTDGFRALSGSLTQGTKLRDIVCNFKQFQAWMQHWAMKLSSEGDRESRPFEIEVAPPLLKRRERTVFHANAYLIQVRQKARPSELGVEHTNGSVERVRDMLCVMELRAICVQGQAAKSKRLGVPSVSTWPVSGRISSELEL